MLNQSNPGEGGAKVLTVDEAREAMARWHDLRGHSEGTATLDNWVLGAIGKPPEAATLADLEAVVLRSRAKATRASYASRIRSIYRALREMGLVTTTVDLQLPRLRAPRSKPRPLTEQQVAALKAGMAQPHLDVVKVALLTGARSMEVHAMAGADLVDGEHGPELLLHGKGDKHVAVPAHPAVVQLVESYGTLGRLWPEYRSPGVLSHWVGSEMRRVLGEYVEFHQCRHTFGTRVYQATSDIYLTSNLMRHSSVATTQVYAAIADSRPRAAVELLKG